MMNLQALLMLLCTLFLTMGYTMGAPYLRRSLSATDMAPICKRASTGVYTMRMVKADRVIHFVENYGALAGRCGPEHCEHFCMVVEKAVSYKSYGAGDSCECKFE